MLSYQKKKSHQKTKQNINTLILFTKPVTNTPLCNPPPTHFLICILHPWQALFGISAIGKQLLGFSALAKTFSLCIWCDDFHVSCITAAYVALGARWRVGMPAYQWLCSSKRGGGAFCLVVGCLKMKTLNELAVRFDIFAYIQPEWTLTLFFTPPPIVATRSFILKCIYVASTKRRWRLYVYEVTLSRGGTAEEISPQLIWHSAASLMLSAVQFF